jgi:acyl-CoA synthetase (AMP-forming)/AMP-acid ligase II/acyl carrier protein
MATDRNKQQILVSGSENVYVPDNTIVEVCERNAGRNPGKILYYFLEDGLNETSRITFGEMQLRAKAIAGELQTKYTKGDRALMLFPPGIEFIVSLFGCFYSGIIAVPAYPPRKNRLFERFESIVNDSRPSVIITTRKLKEDIQKNFYDKKCLQGIDILEYEEIGDEKVELFRDPGLTGDDLALLQYTSGSTGTPHGVMVSHRNIIVNSEFIRQAFRHDENLMGVNWLPGFHDMGLIGALLQPLYVGGSNAIIPPNSFLLRPMNWLRAISKYRSDTAGGPNFALDFCVSHFKADELEGADLSSVKPFFCGAEPIRKETLERFCETFKPYHFRPEQLYPCYGLAESVLIVTGGHLDEKPVYLHVNAGDIEKGIVTPVSPDDPESRAFVSNGFPWLGTTVAIVDPASCKINPAGVIGEIWVSGPSITKGYWNNPEETERTFRAYLADTGEGPFLRTGDLGFIHDGHLYISGRIKDLIIIRGLNHYPHDIEHTAELAHEALQTGAVAAFSVDIDNEERLVIAGEVKRTFLRDLKPGEVFESVMEAVAENHQLQVYSIVLLKPGSLPKTSSGKIQRYACKTEYLRNELEIIANQTTDRRPETGDRRPSTADQIQDWLIAWMVKELKISRGSIDIDKQITAYGLDSLKAVVLARDAEDYFGVEWPLELFLEETSVRQIAAKGRDLMESTSS